MDLLLLSIDESFSQRMSDFASLVSLILVFVTIFTQQRSGRLHALWQARPTRREAARAVGINAVLCIGTLSILLTGVRLWIDALDELALLPKDADEAGAALFMLAWLFLAGLISWQAYLVYDAVALMRSRPRS